MLPDATVMPDGPAMTDAPPDVFVPQVKVLVVHASPNLPAIRLCFAVGSKPDGSDATFVDAPPFPDPRVDPGGAFVLPKIGDLSGVVVPYAINATKATGQSSCASVLALDAGLVPGGDYQKLAPIPAGTIAGMKTVLLAVTGCLGTTFDANASAARCGSDFSPLLGNLAMRAFELDRSPHNGQLGVQLAHLSPPLSTVAAALKNAPDASPIFIAPIATSVRYLETKPTPAAAVVIPSVQSTVISVDVLDPDGGVNPIATYTFPLPGDAGIINGANTTFTLLGEPDSGLRVIALPNDPN
jgi:hypothetical protein